VSYGGRLPRLSPAAVDQALDDALALGVGWIRLDFAWDAIQPASPEVFDWSASDAIADAVNKRHMALLPVLQYTPVWARAAACGATDHCRPANPDRFAAFAAAAARRYAPLGVHAWEIWNEPNTSGAWQPAPDPVSYAALAKATSQAIKVADPSAVVISGGLAPSATRAGDVSQLDFLTGFAEAGGLSAVDAVGYHPYSYPAPPRYYADWSGWSQIAATPRSMKDTLASFGFPDMKIWATEYGAPTNGPGLAATVANYLIGQSPDHVDEALQAQMATQSVQLAKSSPLIAALFWYTQTDAGTSTADRENFFGLRRADGSAKPAYDALAQAIAAARR
jgi:beta-xylosidase